MFSTLRSWLTDQAALDNVWAQFRALDEDPAVWHRAALMCAACGMKPTDLELIARTTARRGTGPNVILDIVDMLTLTEGDDR